MVVQVIGPNAIASILLGIINFLIQSRQNSLNTSKDWSRTLVRYCAFPSATALVPALCLLLVCAHFIEQQQQKQALVPVSQFSLAHRAAPSRSKLQPSRDVVVQALALASYHWLQVSKSTRADLHCGSLPPSFFLSTSSPPFEENTQRTHENSLASINTDASLIYSTYLLSFISALFFHTTASHGYFVRTDFHQKETQSDLKTNFFSSRLQ